MMRKFDVLPADIGEAMEADRADFDAATETMTTITPLLYQSGYLTIKGNDPDTELYTLAIPNKEIRIGLYRNLLPHYLAGNAQKGNTTIAKLFALDDLPVTKVGIGFCLDEKKNIAEWIIE